MDEPLIWAGGLFAEHRYQPDRLPLSVVRLDRDGAAGLALKLDANFFAHTILRPLHAHLLYLGWLWQTISLRTSVELDIRLLWPGLLTMKFQHSMQHRKMLVPDGIEINDVGLRREVVPDSLRRAGVRHSLVRDMADRVHQAYGLTRANLALNVGRLYGRDGRLLGFSYHGRRLWNDSSQSVAIVYDSGRVEHPNQGHLLGFLREGVLLDPAGRTIGLLEFGSGPGVHDEFMHGVFPDEVRPIAKGDSGTPDADPVGLPSPAPMGEWSDIDLETILRPDADPPFAT